MKVARRRREPDCACSTFSSCLFLFSFLRVRYEQRGMSKTATYLFTDNNSSDLLTERAIGQFQLTMTALEKTWYRSFLLLHCGTRTVVTNRVVAVIDTGRRTQGDHLLKSLYRRGIEYFEGFNTRYRSFLCTRPICMIIARTKWYLIRAMVIERFL